MTDVSAVTHIDLSEGHAAIVFCDDGTWEVYVPAMTRNTDPMGIAGYRTVLCAIFLQDEKAVEAVVERANQELYAVPQEEVDHSGLVIGQCPICFAINKHEDNCKARIVGQCPVCRGVNVHESTCALLKGV